MNLKYVSYINSTVSNYCDQRQRRTPMTTAASDNHDLLLVRSALCHEQLLMTVTPTCDWRQQPATGKNSDNNDTMMGPAPVSNYRIVMQHQQLLKSATPTSDSYWLQVNPLATAMQ